MDAKSLFGDKLPSACTPLVQWVVEGSTPGFDFSGTVLESPPDSPYAAGDEVFGLLPPFYGSMQDFISVPQKQLCRKPVNLSFAEVAALPLVGLTATQLLLEDHDLRAGHRLLILGASGGVGHAAVQVARAVGASVTGVCSGKNAEFVKTLGAMHVVDYTSEDLLEKLGEIVSQEGPYDLVMDCVSSHDSRDAQYSYEKEIRAIKLPNKLLAGKYVVLGGYTSDWFAAGMKKAVGVSLFSQGRELFWIRPYGCTAGLKLLCKWAESGKVIPSVSATYSFTEQGVQEAFHKLKQRHVVGKIVLDLKKTNDNHSQPKLV